MYLPSINSYVLSRNRKEKCKYGQNHFIAKGKSSLRFLRASIWLLLLFYLCLPFSCIISEKSSFFRQRLLFFSRRPWSFSPFSSQPLSPPCWPPLSSLWIRWSISMIDRYVLLSCTLNIWTFWGTPFHIWHIEIDFLVTSSCIRFDRLFNNTSMH